MPHLGSPFAIARPQSTKIAGLWVVGACSGPGNGSRSRIFRALILALLISLVQSLVPFVAVRRQEATIALFVRHAALGQFLFIAFSFGCLTYMRS